MTDNDNVRRARELINKYDALQHEVREQMDEFRLARRYVRPLFKALGWSVSPISKDPSQADFVLEYQDVRIPVEVRNPRSSLGPRPEDHLGRLAKDHDSCWGILTNFKTILIWDFRAPDDPVLKEDLRSYFVEGRKGDNLLEAKTFYKQLALGAPVKGDMLPPNQALAQARQIPNPARRADELVRLALSLPVQPQEKVLQEALTAVQEIEGEAARVEALIGLGQHLQKREGLQGEALAMARGLESEECLVEALIGLAPYLSEELRRQALATAEGIKKEECRTRALTGLAPHLPEELQERALKMARAIQDKMARMQAPSPDLGAYGKPDGPRQRFEKVMAGVSFGSGGTLARTITALVIDKEGNPKLLLPGDNLSIGAEIVQPSRQDGDSDRGRIGTVDQVALKATCVAALAELEGDRAFLSTLPDGRPITGIKEPAQGLSVRKYGAGSGYQAATITWTSRTHHIKGEGQESITLQNVFFLESTEFKPEDIGALVVWIDNENNHAVGVIVDHHDSGAFCLPIQPMLDELGVKLVQESALYYHKPQLTDEIAAHTDRAIGEDRLGFTHYVKAFVRLIKDTDHPLTIGIYGAWGTGKTFLMNKIAEELGYDPHSKPTLRQKLLQPLIEGAIRLIGRLRAKPDSEANGSPPQDQTPWQRFRKKLLRPLEIKTLVVCFEAWDYNASDKLWAGLVERIFQSIENSGLGWYSQLRINLMSNLERQWRSFRARLLPYTLLAIVVVVLTIGFALNDQVQWAAAVSVPTVIVLVGRALIDVLSTSASQRIVDLFAAPNYTDDLGFMGRIRKDLEGFAESLTEGMKVVVFIDDLDRCDPKKAVEVLEAVKLLLDFERFFVFLALDARIITQAIEEHYGKVLADAEVTGYEYLDKIVQIPFSIPEPPQSELRKYMGWLVGMKESEIPQMIPASRPGEGGGKVVSEPMDPKGDGTDQPPVPPPGTGATEPGQHKPIEIVPEETPLEVTPPPKPTEQPLVCEVSFTPDEQAAFLDSCLHLDTNPRRIKRLVNVYRLVRALVESRKKELGKEVSVSSNLPRDNCHILAWLVLCEQWPYASHMMLEALDRTLKEYKTDPAIDELLGASVEKLWQAAKEAIDKEGDEDLKKLDLPYDRLQNFMETCVADLSLTLEDVRRLQPFTANFNPILSAEVRLTLRSGNHSPVKPVKSSDNG